MTVPVTHHAVLRYQERVADIPEDQVRQRLQTAALRMAVELGAAAVKLSGGQRAVITDGVVVTILPRKPAGKYLYPKEH